MKNKGNELVAFILSIHYLDNLFPMIVMMLTAFQIACSRQR